MTITIAIDPEAVATVTLNRPALGNRYDDSMLLDLLEGLDTLASRQQLRCMVLRGTGPHFCVGADLQAGEPDDAASPAPALSTVLLKLDRFPCPVIAVVQGACIGGGAAMVACCDIALARSDAFFAIPEVRLGFPPSALAPFFIRAIGYRQFRRYAVTGERFNASQAAHMGLVHQIFEDSEATVLSPIIAAIRRGGPAAVQQTKQAAAAAARPRIDEAGLAALETHFLAIRGSAEALEGVASFREKRNPEWFDGN